VPNDLDLRMMARCIELSRDSISAGELPFGCVICHDDEVVTEATNRVVRDGDVTRHAEMIAMSEAQRVLGTKRLSRCTLYTNVEPCAMCCYCIRETRMRKLVYAIRSPIMGGHSKWKIYRTRKFPASSRKFSAASPRSLAQAVWRDWHPMIWRI